MPLRSWFSNVSQTATSGTLVTPSVITMMPGTGNPGLRTEDVDCFKVTGAAIDIQDGASSISVSSVLLLSKTYIDFILFL